MTIRLTQKRTEILNILKGSHSTLSAAGIHKKLPHIDLVTIYRNLDLFANEKMIKRVRINDDEAQYEYQEEPHHHAVCTECNKVLHFTAPDEKIKKLLDIQDFDVEEIELTVHGMCHKKH